MKYHKDTAVATAEEIGKICKWPVVHPETKNRDRKRPPPDVRGVVMCMKLITQGPDDPKDPLTEFECAVVSRNRCPAEFYMGNFKRVRRNHTIRVIKNIFRPFAP